MAVYHLTDAELDAVNGGGGGDTTNNTVTIRRSILANVNLSKVRQKGSDTDVHGDRNTVAGGNTADVDQSGSISVSAG